MFPFIVKYTTFTFPKTSLNQQLYKKKKNINLLPCTMPILYSLFYVLSYSKWKYIWFSVDGGGGIGGSGGGGSYFWSLKELKWYFETLWDISYINFISHYQITTLELNNKSILLYIYTYTNLHIYISTYTET